MFPVLVIFAIFMLFSAASASAHVQRRRLRRAGKLPLRLTAAVTDPAGNRRTITRRVRLVRAIS